MQNIYGVVPHDNYLVAYNGYTFDPATTQTVSVRHRPIQSADKRTIKYVECTFTVKSRIHSDRNNSTTTDDQMENILQRLTSQGGAFYYRDKGMGDFVVNAPEGVKRDVAWGPVGEVVDCKVVADSYAWDITWSCKVCVPLCDAAKFEGAVMEWCWDVTYRNDDGGYSTREVKGFIEIPLTRANQGDRFLRASADDYREKIAVKCPNHFRPNHGGIFRLSQDRRRLDFEFSHTQLPGPVPPPGILKVKLSQSLSNEQPMVLTKYTWTLRGEYEMVYGMSPQWAGAHFLQCWGAKRIELLQLLQANPNAKQNNGAGFIPGLIRDGIIGNGIGGAIGDVIGNGINQNNAARIVFPILGIAAQGIGGGLGGGGLAGAGANAAKPRENAPAADVGIQILPVYFSAEDPDYYGKPRANFSLTAMIAGAQMQFMTAGLWTPFKNEKHGWGQWWQKAETVFGVRGSAGLKFDPTDDVIIDLCRNNEPKEERLKSARVVKMEIPNPIGRLIAEVDPRNTWIDWENDLEYLQDSRLHSVKPLPEDRTLKARLGTDSGGLSSLRSQTNLSADLGISSLKTPAAAGLSGLGGLDSLIPPENRNGAGGFAPQSGGANELPSLISRQASNTYTVVMRGFALRFGEVPNPPSLVSIGGVPAVGIGDSRLGDGFRWKAIGNIGAPVYAAVWQLRYLLPVSPSVL